MFLYVACSDNKLQTVELNDETGDLIRILPTISPGRKKDLHLSTEFIVQHPTLPVLFALTVSTATKESFLTTYRIETNNGTLDQTKISNTGGLEACFAGFSPNGQVLCIAHKGNGKLSFWDCSTEDIQQLKIIDTPNPLVKHLGDEAPPSSVVHAAYAPCGNYLLAVNAKGRIYTYNVTEGGIPDNVPIHKQSLVPIHKLSQFMGFVQNYFYDDPTVQKLPLIRRIAFHPSGKFLYVLFERHSVVQVYELLQGRIVADCLQELPTIDPSFFNSWKPTGLAWNTATELVATSTGIVISNGCSFQLLGRAENSLRFFDYTLRGTLALQQVMAMDGPVHHFLYCTEKKILAGVDTGGVVETFLCQEEHGSAFQKTGVAAIHGGSVFCLAVAPSLTSALTSHPGQEESTV